MPRLRLPYTAFIVLALSPVVAVLMLSTPGATHPVLQVGPVAGTCASATFVARSTARATVRAQASVSLPVAVTERIAVAGAAVSVTRSETIFEHGVLSRPVAATASARSTRRACARGRTLTGAHRDAARVAARAALAAARATARSAAGREVERLAVGLRAAVTGQERRILTARAQAAAEAARSALAQEALADAASELALKTSR